MKALIFIQDNNGKIYYKTDSFWNISSNIRYSKIYSNDRKEDIDSWIVPFEYNLYKALERDNSKLENYMALYHGCKMGYRTVDEKFISGYILLENTTNDDLGLLVYTHKISFNGFNRPIIFDVRRDEKIKKIIENEID